MNTVSELRNYRARTVIAVTLFTLVTLAAVVNAAWWLGVIGA